MANQPDQLVSKGFYIRFSASDPRDVQLSHWIRADTEARSVNVSAVIKALLYAWYELRWRLGRLPAPSLSGIDETPAFPPGGNGHKLALPGSVGEELGENPDDPLVQSMLSLSFEEWARR